MISKVVCWGTKTDIFLASKTLFVKLLFCHTENFIMCVSFWCWFVAMADTLFQRKYRNYTVCAEPCWSVDSAGNFFCQTENFQYVCVSFWRWLVDLAGNSIQRQNRNYNTCAKHCWSVDSAGNFFATLKIFNMCVSFWRWLVDSLYPKTK